MIKSSEILHSLDVCLLFWQILEGRCARYSRQPLFPIIRKPLGKIVKILYGTMLFSYLDIFSSHHHYYHCQQTWSHDLGFLEQVTPLAQVQQLKKTPGS